MPTRFHVILEDRQYTFLCGESERTSVSIAELVRRAIDGAYGLKREERAEGLELSLAVWRRPDAAIIGRRPGVKLRR
jgi:hypothetical protein